MSNPARMDKFAAQSITGLAVKEFTGEVRNDFLKCQLGEWEDVVIPVSAWKKIHDKVFRLIAYGPSWEDAIDMLERKQKAQKL